jgi:hypothetical protein
VCNGFNKVHKLQQKCGLITKFGEFVPTTLWGMEIQVKLSKFIQNSMHMQFSYYGGDVMKSFDFITKVNNMI